MISKVSTPSARNASAEPGAKEGGRVLLGHHPIAGLRGQFIGEFAKRRAFSEHLEHRHLAVENSAVRAVGRAVLDVGEDHRHPRRARSICQAAIAVPRGSGAVHERARRAIGEIGHHHIHDQQAPDAHRVAAAPRTPRRNCRKPRGRPSNDPRLRQPRQLARIQPQPFAIDFGIVLSRRSRRGAAD